MIRKNMMLFLFVMLLTTHKLFAGMAVPVTVHLFAGASYTDQELYDMICTVNRNYNDPPNSAGIHFYINEIRRNSASCTSRADALGKSARAGGINIYKFGSTLTYSSTDGDVIWVSGINATVLTHEIGHLLGLQHVVSPGGALYPAPACDCISTSGDFDCVTDTYPTSTNNWMMSGGGSEFTPGQISRMFNCMTSSSTGRGWTSTPGLYALANDYLNVIPKEMIEAIDWMSTGVSINVPGSPGCVNGPVSAILKVTTQCPKGSKQYQYTINWPDVNVPLVLNTINGLKEIEYTYFYPDGSKNVIVKPYSAAMFPNNSYCEVDNDPASKSTGITMSNNEPKFKVLNTTTSSIIKIYSINYQQLYVFDISGREVKQLALSNGENNLDMSDLSSGQYVIKAMGKNEMQTTKIIKQ